MTDIQLEQFLKPKQAWELLAMSRSTFYHKAQTLKDKGFPQLYKMGTATVCRASEIKAWQDKVIRGEA